MAVKKAVKMAKDAGEGFFDEHPKLSEAYDKFKGRVSTLKQHPVANIARGAGIAANIGGLFDNDQLGAQATLAALGGIGGTPFGHTLDGALIGGSVGSLFDTLINAKQNERQAKTKQMQQNQHIQRM